MTLKWLKTHNKYSLRNLHHVQKVVKTMVYRWSEVMHFHASSKRIRCFRSSFLVGDFVMYMLSYFDQKKAAVSIPKTSMMISSGKLNKIIEYTFCFITSISVVTNSAFFPINGARRPCWFNNIFILIYQRLKLFLQINFSIFMFILYIFSQDYKTRSYDTSLLWRIWEEHIKKLDKQ